ncbi:alpha/beta hydrolase [Muribaculaceae bacterium Isolate-002 (NCI)]|jgi:hypothetical protein|nr:alpha/beta hydrolase [Muribaculaceae bacterium Isolate-002 (NCI)]
MKLKSSAAALLIATAATVTSCSDTENKTDRPMDKTTLTFNVADNVRTEKVHFKNRFGIELTGDMYIPKDIGGDSRLPAIAVCGPFGAVKEQASGYWANRLAAEGFITLAFDPSFTGESGGEPRFVSSPDINTEDFSAAVDYLMSRDDVDSGNIGITGICGWGGIALNAAAADTRIKAIMPVTMYDMHRVTANGYFDADDSAAARDSMRQRLNAQRNADFASGEYMLAGGLPDERPAEPQFLADYWDYYKTERGYAANSLNSNGGWNTTSAISWLNTPLLAYAGEITAPVMILHGENAHSRYFGEDAFKLLKGDNKQLTIVPGATHCDLYDGGPRHDMIPWDTVIAFFNTNLQN